MEKKSEKNEVKTESASKITLANKIWDDIKDTTVEMFALPNQTVKDYCTPINIDPTKLYLVTRVGAILPALELALKGKYQIEQVDRYISVSKI